MSNEEMKIITEIYHTISCKLQPEQNLHEKFIQDSEKTITRVAMSSTSTSAGSLTFATVLKTNCFSGVHVKNIAFKLISLPSINACATRFFYC